MSAESSRRRASPSDPDSAIRVPSISGAWRLTRWLSGILGFAAVVLVVLHLGEIDRFVALAQTARPAWLALALLAQAATYVCAASIWHRTLRRAGLARSLVSLVPLGVAKLFMDQALPSGGISGTVLIVRGLARRAVPRHLTMAALLVGLVSYYTAYLAIVLVSLGILWLHHRADPAVVAGLAVFAALSVAIPTVVLWLRRRWVGRPLPLRLDRFPGLSSIVRAVGDAPSDLLASPHLLAETTMLQILIFALDALTLWVTFRALGQPADFWVAFVAFVIASVADTIGFVPLGLGTFEAASVGMLHLLDVPIETALAVTVLFRGMTLWLPIIPGLWLARRNLGPN